MHRANELPHTKTREEQVAVFNQIMGQPISHDPKSVPVQLRELAINLIFEELHELAKASGVGYQFEVLCEKAIDQSSSEEVTEEVNEELQLDGLCDTQYTVSWAINVLGHSKRFNEAFDETCMSNDSKACATIEEAEATKMYWEDPKTKDGGEACWIDTIETDDNTYFVVKRVRDQKVRKSVNYTPANFKQFFN